MLDWWAQNIVGTWVRRLRAVNSENLDSFTKHSTKQNRPTSGMCRAASGCRFGRIFGGEEGKESSSTRFNIICIRAFGSIASCQKSAWVDLGRRLACSSGFVLWNFLILKKDSIGVFRGGTVINGDNYLPWWNWMKIIFSIQWFIVGVETVVSLAWHSWRITDTLSWYDSILILHLAHGSNTTYGGHNW